MNAPTDQLNMGSVIKGPASQPPVEVAEKPTLHVVADEVAEPAADQGAAAEQQEAPAAEPPHQPMLPYQRRNLLVAITGFPEDMPQEIRRALASLFQNMAISITGLTNNLELSTHGKVVDITTPPISPVFAFEEKAKKAIKTFFENWIITYVVGKEHSLCYGVPRVGVDILFVEPDETGTEVVDAWFLQNAIPEHISMPYSYTCNYTVDNDVKPAAIEIQLKGFAAKNNAVMGLARRWLAIQNGVQA